MDMYSSVLIIFGMSNCFDCIYFIVYGLSSALKKDTTVWQLSPKSFTCRLANIAGSIGYTSTDGKPNLLKQWVSKR